MLSAALVLMQISSYRSKLIMASKGAARGGAEGAQALARKLEVQRILQFLSSFMKSGLLIIHFTKIENHSAANLFWGILVT